MWLIKDLEDEQSHLLLYPKRTLLIRETTPVILLLITQNGSLFMWLQVKLSQKLLESFLLVDITKKSHFLFSCKMDYISTFLGSDNLAMRPGPVVGSASSFRPHLYPDWLLCLSFRYFVAVFITIVVKIKVLALVVV